MYSKSSNGSNNTREKKSSSEPEKKPIRSFGEWCEFLSSTGKIYYYNCKTEKAQWEKPDEWDTLIAQE